jgi:hypothetical protein
MMIASVAMRFTKDFEPPTYQTLVIESLDSLSESVQRFNGSTVAFVSLMPCQGGRRARSSPQGWAAGLNLMESFV